MKVFVILVVFCVYQAQGGDRIHVKIDDSEVICGVGDDDIIGFRRNLYDFTIKLYKRISVHSQGHFVISTLPIWQSLAAIAEGSTGLARQQLFQLLGLPDDECSRQSHYQLAAHREPSGSDVSLTRNRLLFVDEELEVNTDWESLALSQFNLITSKIPIKRAPEEAAFSIRHTISSHSATLNFEGNSVLGDSLDYHGLWSEVFPEQGISLSPFYDHNGNQIGWVDMMRTRRRVRQAFIEQLNSKVIEIPVGHDGRYRMLFGIPVKGHNVRKSFEAVTNSVLFEIVDGLEDTQVPVDVAIPRFFMSTESDVRALLEEVGVDDLWTNALATGNISHPAAVPSSFIQRVHVTLDSHGVAPHIQEFTEYALSNLEPTLGNEVVIDRPFMYGLFDAETYTPLFCAAFSVPTYELHG